MEMKIDFGLVISMTLVALIAGFVWGGTTALNAAQHEIGNTGHYSTTEVLYQCKKVSP